MKVKTGTWVYLFFLIITALLCNHYLGFSVNTTNSLPFKIFITYQKANPSVGDYISFKAPLESGLPTNIIITKKILAGPGDLVTKNGQDFFINQKWVAKAKLKSRDGQTLILGPEGKLKDGQYYVGATHPDSLDSRYLVIGWIKREQIITVAHPIF